MPEAPLTPDEFAELLLLRADEDGRVKVVEAAEVLHAHTVAANRAGERV